MFMNKVAIVTGGTSGIGKAVAEMLARDGCKVALVGRDQQRGEETVQAIAAKGGDVMFVCADLISQAAPNLIVSQVAERWGAIDIIVNNAALVCSKPVERITHEDWDNLFAVNVKAPFFMVQTALPWLKKSKGCVINISSSDAVKNSDKNIVYDTSKAALNHMTSGLALDLRKAGIRSNTVMPGGTMTPLLNIWLEQHEDYNMEEEMPKLDSDPSIATCEQIANIVMMVADDRCSWLNGAHILADGGYSIG